MLMFRTITRDVGDADPERMAPPKVAEYIVDAFKGGNVKVKVEADQDVIKKEYPMMAAVSRATKNIPEHQARLIWLEYIPDGPVEETLMLVGKVTISDVHSPVWPPGKPGGLADKCAYSWK
jgi:leucyl aminopeptidase